MEIGSNSYWTVDTDQMCITGDKTGSYNLTTTGTAVFNNTSTIGNANIQNAQILVGSTTMGIGIDSNEIACKGGDCYFETLSDNASFRFQNGTTEVMRINTSSGNLGVGTATPNQKIQVAGAVSVTNTSGIYIGDSTVNGTWRIIASANNLSIDRRENGTWVRKGAFTP